MIDIHLLAENILEDADFLSATEQEGEYWRQPEPDSENAGKLKLLSMGDAEDDSYDGTATSDGAGGGTTVIDSNFDIFGDDFFIGATIEITSGTYNGETSTVTDFVRSTGTFTVSPAFSGQIVTAVTFTVTIPFVTRSFELELITGGDPGDADFKWSHNGGTTYLGRNDPDAANWLAGHEIHSNIASAIISPRMVELNNGDWLVVFLNGDSSNYLHCVKSTDKGLSWGTPVQIDAATLTVDEMLVAVVIPNNGRIIVYTQDYVYYSDDDGATWINAGTASAAGFTGSREHGDGIVMSTGRVYVVSYHDLQVKGCYSNDGGFNFTEVTIASTTNFQKCPSITEAENGNLVCVYASDEDAIGEYDIKRKISSDGGVTWGSAADVMTYSTTTFTYPIIERDADGTLFCSAVEGTTDERIIFATSTDNGITWSSTAVLKSVGSVDLRQHHLCLLDGHIMACVYVDATNSDLDIVRRGMWEAYSANACPVPIASKKAYLVSGASIKFQGSQGIAGDVWTFDIGYYFGMENIISHSPSEPWRSEQDNIECTVVLDAGANERFYADGAALFGCNIIEAKFQMNASDSWSSPSVDELIDFRKFGDSVIDNSSALWGTARHRLSVDEDLSFIRVFGINLSSLFGGQHKHRIELMDSNGFVATGYIGESDVAESYGSEEVTNGDFDSGTTGWTAGNSAQLIGGADPIPFKDEGVTFEDEGVEFYPKTGEGDSYLRIQAGAEDNPYAYQNISVNSGRLLKITFQVRAGTSASYKIYLSAAGKTAGLVNARTCTSSFVTYSFYVTAWASTLSLILMNVCNGGSGQYLDFDTISVTEVFHAGTQGVTIFPTPTPSFGSELVTNGDNEAAVCSFDDDYAEGGGTLTQSSDYAKTGTYSGMITCATVGDGYVFADTEPDSVVYGASYTITGSILAKPGNESGYIIIEFDDGNGFITVQQYYVGGGGTGIFYDFSFNVLPISTFKLRIRDIDCVHQTDYFYIDNLSIKKESVSWAYVSSGFNYNDSSYLLKIYEIGEVDSVNGNYIEDAALLASFKDHELKSYYVKILSGTDSGKVWKILDNVSDYIVLDTDASHNIAADDLFEIFQKRMISRFDEGLYRYMRVLIEAQQTEENYYKIGTMIAGRVVVPSRRWGPSYTKDQVFDINVLRTPHGGLVPIKGADRKHRFTFTWAFGQEVREEVLSMINYLEGKSMALLPNSEDPRDLYLVKQVGDVRQQHATGMSRFTITVNFEEIL